MRVCMACSTKTDESGRFCPECGAVLAVGAGESLDAVPAVAETQPSSPTPAKSAAASLVGTNVDGFRIESVLGGGAFGAVFRGRQLGLDRIVAIKVPTHEIAADPVMARRFAREARAAARIAHPGVVTIHAVGELPDGRPYIAMELIEGEPLDSILSDGPLPPMRALDLARQVASALSETHAADVVHRDLKPSNIVWRRDRNGDERVTLVDFGIAVCKPGTADATRLTAGGLIGTPHYMSPEQAHGDHVDARADIYALGCILFELLTGEPPFEGSGFEVLLAHLGRPVPKPSERVATLPPSIDELVGQMTAKKPDQRVPSADALVARIDDVLDELEGLRPASSPAPKPTRAKRKTAGTLKDKPKPVPPAPGPRATSYLDPEPRGGAAYSQPIHRWRWLAAGAVIASVVAVAGFAALRLTKTSSAQERDPTDEIKRIEIFRDDGETRLRVWVPELMRAGRSHRLHIELRNKLGAFLIADQVIVTIENPDGKATGVIARPRNADPDQFGVGYLFEKPGVYKVRIFPPETTSTFAVDVPVTE
ncbi:MAG: serine/threonine protein kinase [Myxococcota bacterium]|nr:serine/threonine protein kinase [Myxococcota bacterium]